MMRLKLVSRARKGEFAKPEDFDVEFLIDVGEHSCGESRADWRQVDCVPLPRFLAAALKIGEGAERVDI